MHLGTRQDETGTVGIVILLALKAMLQRTSDKLFLQFRVQTREEF